MLGSLNQTVVLHFSTPELSPVGWKEKSIDLSGCYFLKLARIPNEDPTYPNIFLDMVFLRSKGHLAKPRNVHRLR
jgi:hypothetical protein